MAVTLEPIDHGRLADVRNACHEDLERATGWQLHHGTLLDAREIKL